MEAPDAVPQEVPDEAPSFEDFQEPKYQPSLMETLGALTGPVMVAVVVAAVAYHHLRPALLQWWAKRKESALDAQLAKDPDLLIAREAAVEAARRRMQQRHDAASADQEERRRQREEAKRRAVVEASGARVEGRGRRLGEAEAAPEAPPQPAEGAFRFRRAEYNPLMGGDGGSCGWRPARRGGASGG